MTTRLSIGGVLLLLLSPPAPAQQTDAYEVVSVGVLRAAGRGAVPDTPAGVEALVEARRPGPTVEWCMSSCPVDADCVRECHSSDDVPVRLDAPRHGHVELVVTVDGARLSSTVGWRELRTATRGRDFFVVFREGRRPTTVAVIRRKRDRGHAPVRGRRLLP